MSNVITIDWRIAQAALDADRPTSAPSTPEK